MKTDKFKHQDEWKDWVGLEVAKHSGKPFKSGKSTGLVTEYTVNPHSNKVAFKMDDGSVVDCYQVTKLIKHG